MAYRFHYRRVPKQTYYNPSKLDYIHINQIGTDGTGQPIFGHTFDNKGYTKARMVYTNSTNRYNAELRSAHYENAYNITSLVFRVVLVALVLAFIFFVFSKPFDFHDFAHQVVTTNWAPFDFPQMIAALEQWKTNLPSYIAWAGDAVEAFYLILLSLGYTAGVAIKFLGLLFGVVAG